MSDFGRDRRTALLAGATGKVGRECLRLLLADERYERVQVLARAEVPLTHRKLCRHQVDFAKLGEIEFPAVDDVYSTLGIRLLPWMRIEEVERVEYRYPLTLARLAKEAGARRFLTVTSVEADPDAWLHYLRVKGELERDLRGLDFESLHLFRPSFLCSSRSVAAVANAVLRGDLRRFRVVDPARVAAAMIEAAHEADATEIHHFLEGESRGRRD